MLFEIQMDMPLSFSSLNLAPVFHFEKYMGSRKAHGTEKGISSSPLTFWAT